jgi:predicted GIY-YIG superfamily endonuclease
MPTTRNHGSPPLPRRPSRSRWLVYLLRCRDGSLYTGITNDLDRRLKAHAAGTASRYTRSRLPVTLAYSEPQPTKSRALKREAAIKKLRRAEKERLVARG